MADERTTVELPCEVCGAAAARISLDDALDLLPGKILFTIKGGARFAGMSIDWDSPTLGFSPENIAEMLHVTCIACVDAGNAGAGVVDNNTDDATDTLNTDGRR